MEYSIECSQSNKKTLKSKKYGWSWLSLSYLMCSLELGLSFRAVVTFQSSTYLRGFLACILGGTVDQNALPMSQMISN